MNDRIWEMRKLKFIVLVVAGALFVAGQYNRGRRQEVLGLVSPQADPLLVTVVPVIPTPTPTPEPEPTTTKPKPVSTPTPAPIPSPAPSMEINGYIDRFSAQYGVDPNVIRHVAICESGFNSSAVNYIYAGLFQFGSTTWRNIRLEMGENPDDLLRFSAQDSVQTAAYAISKGKGGMWPNCFPK